MEILEGIDKRDMNYSIANVIKTFENGIKWVMIKNEKSGMEHRGFVYPSGKVTIMVGTFAKEKQIKLA